jgi:hypothetical protein
MQQGEKAVLKAMRIGRYYRTDLFTVYNQLDHVLRLAGSVIQFQVAGKSIALNAAGHYDDFLNGIILPRQQGDFDIHGPDLATAPVNTTIALFIYDVGGRGFASRERADDGYPDILAQAGSGER